MESTASTPYLSISRANQLTDVPLLGENSWRLGRGSQCAIILDDDMVSRNHAMIQRTGAREYVLIDMGSRNGSFVNERRLSTPVRLRDGDRITLGNAQIVFHNPEETSGVSSAVGVDALATVSHFMQCLVSVLVMDIRGFTVLSQQFDEGMLCRLTGTWFGEADRIMRSHGSATEKYIGDAVMALWLHQAPGREHLEILEILRAVAEFADVTAKLGERFGRGDHLRVGAGLNTGVATVGNTGTNRVIDYTATGECVNTAFRLETATKDLGTDLCLGKVTADYLRYWPRAASCFQEKEVFLKGYDAPVRACPIRFDAVSLFLQGVDAAAV